MSTAKHEALHVLTENGVIAVIRKVPNDKILQVAESLIAGGVNALELTLDTEDAFHIIQQLNARFGDRVIVGAGTVLDDMSAELAIQSGAEFVVSPILKESVISQTLLHGKISIPGVMTPSEMVKAVEYGADIVKVFPASVNGPEFIKHINGPLPSIPIIPTGGINLDNAKDYIEAGAVSVGAGGQLLDKEAIANEDYEKIKRLAKQYVDVVKKARKDNG
ncbi:2-dehydro-3-deoxyphosphogluconate aldolase / (4S)-4-hydroxy-2-oxoglutarate aldolase [Salinibacillus kushneri]|uniref:2-dehydro-3-deoxyphosphogluconate aldolase / (4S)-4-hydroxy-2-oxoglutarate aldolase n=1 Tax=Salinibacillus kushneri TaxID=237682 RepID=A0A1I0C9W4_9BACI|nr:bifunctional 4-hydroxy-2-oxoglutarate aldolase/2-dehydro-3-deoxy-phosphogluconate aldolase [Salinibacillus kushneri]SET16163.1 2-dehydro-3-deoxyphosphogluconate aldolase / (4S)-4-hydroxy-2-oxoglutarate aldolase [Salinibacillus kushneri]